MNQPVNVPSTTDLDMFIEFLFEGLEGYCYLVAKQPGSKDPDDWNQEFFEYPAQSSFLKTTILKATNQFEIYLAPVLYADPTGRAIKENVKISNVVWTEFDGASPDWSDFAGPPSLIVQSSTEDHTHVYWRLNEPISNILALEDINRRITYNFGADTSAWDATQVLRPPATYNHKRSLPVSLSANSGTVYDTEIFDSLAPAPQQIETETWSVASLPDIQDVILKYSFGPDLVGLLKKDKADVPDRSASLMNMAYGCAQLGLQDVEIFVILRMLDDRWEKFKGRRDRDKRLAHIITVARNKYPDTEKANLEEDAFALIMDYGSFMAVDIQIDWVVEGMLMEQGNMLMVGASGIGKTQVSLEFMKHIALGKNFLGYNIPEPKKIGFLSLEMGHPDLKKFLEAQDVLLNDAERALLAENLHIIPLGESLALNTESGQKQLETVLDQFNWDGLFVDSVGSAVLGNINSQEVVQGLTNFNDRIKNKYKLFLWYIHHMRKAQPGQSAAASQDDVYGDQYLVNRATSVYALSKGKEDTIRMRNFKQRLAAKEDDYYIKRLPSLSFERTTVSVDENIKKNMAQQSETTVAPNGLEL